MHRLAVAFTLGFLLVGPPLRADESRVVVASSATQPQVAVTDSGEVFVVYLKSGNIEVKASTDRGKTFGQTSIAIDARGMAKGGFQRGPRIDVDGSGNVHVTAPVCFDAEELKKKYPAGELWYTVSRDQGKTWSPPVQINGVPKKAAEGLHWMAVDLKGRAHVAWLDSRDGKGQSLYYARISDGKVGRNQRLVATVCECCAPAIAVTDKGNPLVAVRGGGGQGRATLLMKSSSKGKSWSKPQRLNPLPANLDG